jgi:hypothetical protein
LGDFQSLSKLHRRSRRSASWLTMPARYRKRAPMTARRSKRPASSLHILCHGPYFAAPATQFCEQCHECECASTFEPDHDLRARARLDPGADIARGGSRFLDQSRRISKSYRRVVLRR